MKITDFTVEEINLISTVHAPNKEQTILNLFDVMPDIKDITMKKLAETVFRKLEQMSDTDFVLCQFAENTAV